MSPTENGKLTLPQAGSARLYVETLALLSIAAGAWIFSGEFAGQDPLFRWGPEFWPRVVASVLALLALLQFWGRFQALRRSSDQPRLAGSGAEAGQADEQERFDVKRAARLAMTIGFPVLFLLLMSRVGFLLAAPFFIVTMMLHFGVRNWLHLTVTATGTYLLFVAVFVRLLGVPLPTGDWPAFRAINIALRGMLGL